MYADPSRAKDYVSAITGMSGALIKPCGFLRLAIAVASEESRKA
jgi:hypothetical protein